MTLDLETAPPNLYQHVKLHARAGVLVARLVAEALATADRATLGDKLRALLDEGES